MTGAMSEATRQAALAAAEQIAIRIARKALWNGDECTWEVVAFDLLPASSRPSGRSTAADETLYQGTAGIALFLLEAYVVTHKPELLRAAEGAMRHSIRRSAASAPYKIGFYSGRAGVAYAAARVATQIWVGQIHGCRSEGGMPHTQKRMDTYEHRIPIHRCRYCGSVARRATGGPLVGYRRRVHRGGPMPWRRLS